MRPLLNVALLLVLMLAPLAAQAKRTSLPRDGFYYGMKLADANALLKASADYAIAYRVDTQSTSDIFCRYQQHTLYLTHFLRGACHSVEKRAIVSFEDADKMFVAYFKTLGDTDEVAQSTDRRSRYAKWRFKDRELILSAYGREDGTFLLVHEEYDPLRISEAVVLQQRELSSMPQQLDPLTGQPLPLLEQPSEKAAQQARDSVLPIGAAPAPGIAQEWQNALPAGAAAPDDAAADPAPAAEDPAATGAEPGKGKAKPGKAKKQPKAKQAKAGDQPAEDAAPGSEAQEGKDGDEAKEKPKDKEPPRITDKNDWN
jgi:hypothetical protein